MQSSHRAAPARQRIVDLDEPLLEPVVGKFPFAEGAGEETAVIPPPFEVDRECVLQGVGSNFMSSTIEGIDRRLKVDFERSRHYRRQVSMTKLFRYFTSSSFPSDVRARADRAASGGSAECDGPSVFSCGSGGAHELTACSCWCEMSAFGVAGQRAWGWRGAIRLTALQ